ncbi:MAG: ImmA/IrrE family metallo-endopeptidase [Oscillospiraceae bacterium]
MNYIYNLTEELIRKHSTRAPFELCDLYDIHVKYTDYLKRLDGMFTIMNEVPVIIINSKCDDPLQRMICAHELGHFFLHSDIAKEKCLQDFHIFQMRDKSEYQANVFAAHLIIDDDELIDLIKEQYSLFDIAIKFGVDPNLLNIKLLDMNSMGYNFNTSWAGTEVF